MNVLGIDFTSRPSLRKPLTCARCTLRGDALHLDALETWPDYEPFETALRAPGPWIAGLDFPFGQSQTFIQNIGWPSRWDEYVRHAGSFDRDGFRSALDAYRKPRADGDKEHRRATDVAACSISPQKLYGVPVGLMFFEGARRLLDAGVTIPLLQAGDPERVVVEAYPGTLARQLIGRASYKSDSGRKQTPEQRQARHAILTGILDGSIRARFGIAVEPHAAFAELVDDPTGDKLDALLCAIQAAWAWTKRDANFGAPIDVNPREGWIADPSLRNPTA
jgi:hypothetical protein